MSMAFLSRTESYFSFHIHVHQRDRHATGKGDLVTDIQDIPTEECSGASMNQWNIKRRAAISRCHILKKSCGYLFDFALHGLMAQ